MPTFKHFELLDSPDLTLSNCKLFLSIFYAFCLSNKISVHLFGYIQYTLEEESINRRKCKHFHTPNNLVATIIVHIKNWVLVHFEIQKFWSS